MSAEYCPHGLRVDFACMSCEAWARRRLDASAREADPGPPPEDHWSAYAADLVGRWESTGYGVATFLAPWGAPRLRPGDRVSAALPAGWTMHEDFPGYAVIDGDAPELPKAARKAPHVVSWCDARGGVVKTYSEVGGVPHDVVLACIARWERGMSAPRSVLIASAREALDALTGPERVSVLRHYGSSARRACLRNGEPSRGTR